MTKRMRLTLIRYVGDAVHAISVLLDIRYGVGPTSGSPGRDRLKPQVDLDSRDRTEPVAAESDPSENPSPYETAKTVHHHPLPSSINLEGTIDKNQLRAPSWPSAVPPNCSSNAFNEAAHMRSLGNLNDSI